jgi:iron complex transport system permease protein
MSRGVAEMNRDVAAYMLAVIALAALTALAFSVGRFAVSPAELVALAWAKLSGSPHALPANVETVILQVRGPRVLAALLVGGALAAAGTAFQGMFRNPLVSPDLLGVATGAALGAALGIFMSHDVWTVQLFAFAGGLAAVGLVYWVSSSIPRHDPLLALVLTGVVIGTLLGAGIALLKYVADPHNELPAMT